MPCGPQCRCCLIGDCCPPGSAAQRAALKTWLMEKLDFQRPTSEGAATHAASVSSILNARPGGMVPEGATERMVDAWLDELPWKKD